MGKNLASFVLIADSCVVKFKIINLFREIDHAKLLEQKNVDKYGQE